jgi:hypothetical protein
VIGVRYELNDPYICVIAKLVEPEKKFGNVDKDRMNKGKQPISILED